MNDYQIRFLKQSILGQRERINNPKEVIIRCIELADRDMVSGERFVNELFKINKSKKRVEYFFDVLEQSEYVYTKCKYIKTIFISGIISCLSLLVSFLTNFGEICYIR